MSGPMPPKIAIAPRRSMAFFAALAMVMVIASYLFVIALAAACVYLPYLLVANTESLHMQVLLLFLGGLVIAGAMLWSLVPHRDKFEAPGPLLRRESHPRLFAELEHIASSLDEPLPREVYLIGQVNAFVADRGGVLGLGSHRIMAIGLPLLSILNISEFRGVLAHEFAHYYSGDTQLGPFVYKTQSAMIRTFKNIGSIQELNRIAIVKLLYSAVTVVLKNYFILFLRITNFVSRKKEYRADELACLVAGAAAVKGGLRKIHGAAMAWPPYWNTEVAPVLNQNGLPAIGEGFSQFLSVPEVAAQVTQGIDKEIQEGKADIYDTHPPLRDRLAALDRLTLVTAEEDSSLASSLLDSPDSAELQFLTFLNPQLEPNSLRRVSWDDVGMVITIPAWRSLITEFASLLPGVTASAVPDLLARLPDIGSRMQDPKGTLLTPRQRTQRAGHLVASALALALLDKGWQLETKPGLFYLYRGQDQADPFATVSDLIDGKVTKDVWLDTCTRLGIGDALLVPPATLSPVDRP